VQIGIGPSGLSYWASAQPLANIVDPKIANFPAPKPGWTYSRDGWPTSMPPPPDNFPGWGIAATEGYLAPGKYQVWAGGSGTFWFFHPDPYDAKETVIFEAVGPVGGPHRVIGTFNVVHADAGRTQFAVVATDPKNPLSHITVIPETESPSSMFTKQYVNELKNFRVLRLAGYSNVINSPEVNWPEGPVHPFGQPAKWLAGFRLCVETGASPWCNIPHMASDQYVRKLAQYANMVFPHGHTLYLEYGIEIWNWGFPFSTGTKWVQDWTNANLGPNYPYQAGHVERAHHLQAEFIRYAPDLKVVRIFSCQHANPWLFWQAGQYIKAWGYEFDAVATAPYGDAPDLDWAEVDKRLAAGDEGGAMDLMFAAYDRHLPTLDKFAAEYRKLADDLKIPRMITYECGPGNQIPYNWPQPRLDIYAKHHQDQRMHDFLADRYFPWMAKHYDLAMYTEHTRKSGPGEA